MVVGRGGGLGHAKARRTDAQREIVNGDQDNTLVPTPVDCNPRRVGASSLCRSSVAYAFHLRISRGVMVVLRISDMLDQPVQYL